MDLSLQSLAADISQRVVQYYQDNRTSRFETGTRNLDWRKHFFVNYIKNYGKNYNFFLHQRKKERKKERKIVQIYLHTFIILRTLKDERFDLNKHIARHMSLVFLRLVYMFVYKSYKLILNIIFIANSAPR